ncbi:MAG: glycerol-3-phosphate 1-O-acyltransferase PlsY [Candidatus Omnitrophota bacterium]
MIHSFLLVFTAYILGSIPTAYIFGKVLKGIDIRKVGSGNVGATNAARSIGKKAGIVVLIIDFLKGLAAITVIPMAFQWIFPNVSLPDNISIFLAVAVISGHIWTVFLKFKGGKGVATTAGVMTGLAPGIFLGALAVWVIVFSVRRYVSLASILAAVTLPILSALTGKAIEFTLFCAVLCLIGVYSHRSNIKRLIQGTEKKL